MNENETIATAVVADFEGKQGKTVMARHEKVGQIIEDAMYTLSHVSRQLAFGGELHKRNTFELKGLIARVRERVRQPAMACSCVGMLVLGMVMWNGRAEKLSGTTDSPAMVIYREAVAFEKDGNIGRAFDKYVEAAKVAAQTKDSDVFAMAQNRVVKTQRNS